MSSLQDRVAIVTGGAQGIGRHIAEKLHAEGATVVIADLQAAHGVAEALGGLAVEVDVADPAACERMSANHDSVEDGDKIVKTAIDAFGRIDILINNAGIYTSLVPTPFEQLDVAEWKRVFDVNVLGMYLATRAVTPHMRAAGYGRIINMASGTPFKGVPFLLHYVSSKGAVVAMTKALAKELGGDNILVNTVAPGFTMSDGVLANDVQIEKLQEVSVNARVLARDQYPEDIVGAVAFFAGDGAAFITGQALVVDGGAHFN
jgi:NAD(P)-dependent dehydrogenase (short-subunit alcohol dehydrogenase family)